MPAYKTMDQEKILELLEGHKNVVGPLEEKEQAFFRNCSCPNCGSGSHTQFTNPNRPYSSGSPLPNRLLRCLQCAAEWDPHSGLITKMPSDHIRAE